MTKHIMVSDNNTTAAIVWLCSTMPAPDKEALGAMLFDQPPARVQAEVARLEESLAAQPVAVLRPVRDRLLIDAVLRLRELDERDACYRALATILPALRPGGYASTAEVALNCSPTKRAQPGPQTVEGSCPEKNQESLKRIGGSNNDSFNMVLFDQALRSNWTAHADDERARSDLFACTVMALASVKPHDELEGMLAAQLVATHNAAMECYRRAMLGEQTFEGRDNNLKHAGKLSRSYGELLLALDKHRGKGQQKVIVEHVHVHRGGQAIVGAVTQGGGVPIETERQPHASRAITHEPGAPLPCPDPEREAVPVAGGS